MPCGTDRCSSRTHDQRTMARVGQEHEGIVAMRLLCVGLMILCLTGCSVLMALSGNPPRDYAVLKAGSPRELVIEKFGAPTSSNTESGRITDRYDIEEGNTKNPARATMNFYLDFATFGIWELIATPIEFFQGSPANYVVLYGSDGRLVSVTPAPLPELMGAFSSEPTKPQPVASAATGSPGAILPDIAVSDVDQVPTISPKPRKNAYAVVIGVARYRENLPQADFADRDAKLMSAYLTKVMGYGEENVVVLLNERAAKGDLEKYIEGWLPNRVEEGDSVFIYYSGHGTPNPKTGEAYLVPYDGDPTFIDKTGYSLKRLYEHLAKLPLKEAVVVIDSCFSGSGGRSVIAKGMRPVGLSVENPILSAGKTVVLAASAGDQVSSSYDQKAHGLLTYFFLKGLQGEGDGNKDSTIELGELFAYLKPQVERVARREFNNEQTPQLIGSPELLKRGILLYERAGP